LLPGCPTTTKEVLSKATDVPKWLLPVEVSIPNSEEYPVEETPVTRRQRQAEAARRSAKPFILQIN